jgi:hypothetical protein
LRNTVKVRIKHLKIDSVTIYNKILKMDTFVTAYQSKDVSEMVSMLLLLFGVISFVRLASDAIGVCCPRNDRLTELIAEVQYLRATVDSLETLDDKMNEIKTIVADLSAHLGIHTESSSEEESEADESEEAEAEEAEAEESAEAEAEAELAQVQESVEPATTVVTDSQNLFEQHSEDSTNTIVNATVSTPAPKKRTRTKASSPAPPPSPVPTTSSSASAPSSALPVVAPVSGDKSSDKHVMLKRALKSGESVYLSYKKTTFTAKFVVNAAAPHGYYLKSDNTDYNTPSHFSFAKKSSVNPSIHSDNGWDSVYVLVPTSGNGKPSKVCLNDLINK